MNPHGPCLAVGISCSCNNIMQSFAAARHDHQPLQNVSALDADFDADFYEHDFARQRQSLQQLT